MSSKRLLSLTTSQAVKKPRKVNCKPLRMREFVTTADGIGGGEDGAHEGVGGGRGSTVLGVHTPTIPPTCQLLSSPTKSPFDRKEYRVIQLENGLTALLISDLNRIMASPEEEDNSRDESDDDDDEEQEEEVSSEDEEFEEEEEVEDAGRNQECKGWKHGGRDNAHTDMEHTTFYFEVQERYLLEGLDRFAQFFINPLMKKEAMTREREAVHSEFQMALPDDEYRIQQLFGSFAAEGHPMGKFTWGNESTLNTGIPDEELHKKLHELRLKYYSSHYMTLAVQARLSLDKLQEYVCSIFNQIPSNSIHRPTYGHHGFPFPMEKLHRLYRVVTTKEYHCVEIRWVLPSLLKYYHTKPLHYVSHLLGHEGRGSILSYLKKKVWAVGLYSGNDESGFEHNTTCAIMSISIELTDEGFKNIDKVLCVVFQYMAMIQRAGPIERIFREIQQMEQLDFDYAEEQTTIENVENLSEAMQIFPPEDYLTGDTLLSEYNPQVIKECLDALVPEKCNIIISSKTVDEQTICQETEEWFRTKYSVEEIPKVWKEQWANPQSNPDLHIPAPSNFIPDNFDLLAPEKEVPDYPQKLYEDEWGALWFRQDQKFKLPRTYCYVYLITELPLQSPRLAALLDLYLKLFQQQVMEDIYPASMAQYYFSISATEKGLVMKMNGFNQKLHQLLDLLLHHMETFQDNLNEKTFQEIKQQQLKYYHYAILKPGILCKNLCTLELTCGCWIARVNGLNPVDTNSSVINYYQYKEGTLTLEVLLEFIQMVMDEPVFDVLRTREQLGYHVYCTNHNTFGILGLSITVNSQANKFSVSYVDERIEAFLKEFMNTVKNLKNDELSELKETLTSMKQTIDLTLGEEVDRNWSEIVHEEYVFDRLKRQIDLIKNITHESVIECIKQIISSKDNPGYRKLSVQVVGAANPKEECSPSLEIFMGQSGVVELLGPGEESPEKIFPPHQFITDIVNHKKKLRVYPVTKIL
ncbi:nardilysin-like [Panulirus ornatus]|uniref:nardilysin-like n=1 Tax=Panulirus ornatus TaxID=150431 RepID=UPI003A891140